MDLRYLGVKQAIIHEVFSVNDDGRPTFPVYSRDLLDLDDDARAHLVTRIVDATGRQSKSIELDIIEAGRESPWSMARDITASKSDEDFVHLSRVFADRLTRAQNSRSIKGGVLLVFKGTSGDPESPIVGLVKAELHGGFSKGSHLKIRYLNDLFLGPQSTLYKIGLFRARQLDRMNEPEGWDAIVHDHLITSSGREAARYFYESFLGCAPKSTSARTTKAFRHATLRFIYDSDMADDAKYSVAIALDAELKVGQSPTVSPKSFAEAYFPPHLRDSYSTHLAAHGVPDRSFAKDVSFIQSQLRRKRFKFDNDVAFSAPADAFEQDFIEIKTVQSCQGEQEKWTEILVKGRIQSSE